MSPASTVDSPKPPVKAPSRHEDGDEKKDDKKFVPSDGKRHLAETAAEASKPPGGDSWTPADDKGVGHALDQNVPPADAPLPQAPSSMGGLPTPPSPQSPSTSPATTPAPAPPALPPPPDPRGVSGSLLDNHLQNAKKEAEALNTLTTDGNFEKVAGDDGSLSLQEAQQYLQNHPKPPAILDLIEPAGRRKLREALNIVTTNGDFEKLAGGPGKEVTLPQLQQKLGEQQQQIASLETVQPNFKGFAGADERLSREEVQNAAAQTQDPALQSALGWLDQNYDRMAAPSYYADPAQGGPAFDGSVNPDIRQQGEGNCVRLATIYGFSQTPAGKAKLEQMVDKQADGSFNVSFPGDPNKKIYNVKPEELNGQWSAGDPGGQVLATAIEKFGADNPGTDLGQPRQVMNLLTGKGYPYEARFDKPEDVKSYLVQNASAVNSGEAVMTMGGTAQPNGAGNFTIPANHAFTVTNIDVANNLVTYSNPWNPAVKHSIPLDQLSNDASQPQSLSAFTTVSLNDDPAIDFKLPS